MRIGLAGSAFPCKSLEFTLKQAGHEVIIFPRKDSLVNVLFRLNTVDVLHSVYPYNAWREILLAKLLGKPIVCHWIGTDVLVAKSDIPRFALLARLFGRVATIHLAQASHLVDELEQVGIKSQCVPILPANLATDECTQMFNDHLVVLVFIPSHRSDFFRGELVLEVARIFPDDVFLVVGNDIRPSDTPHNVRFLGWQENMKDLYLRSSVLLRLPKHDGLPLMVLEAMSYGLHVVWSYNFPYCYKADSLKSVTLALESIRKRHTPNIEGKSYVKSQFRSRRIANELGYHYRALVKDGPKQESP